MPFTEDLSVFFQEKDFATSITITLSADNDRQITVSAIFEEPTLMQDLSDFIITSTSPYLLLAYTVDVALIAKNDSVRIGQDAYFVSDIPKADGTGTARLYLANAESQDDQDDGGLGF